MTMGEGLTAELRLQDRLGRQLDSTMRRFGSTLLRMTPVLLGVNFAMSGLSAGFRNVFLQSGYVRNGLDRLSDAFDRLTEPVQIWMGEKLAELAAWINDNEATFRKVGGWLAEGSALAAEGWRGFSAILSAVYDKTVALINLQMPSWLGGQSVPEIVSGLMQGSPRYGAPQGGGGDEGLGVGALAGQRLSLREGRHISPAGIIGDLLGKYFAWAEQGWYNLGREPQPEGYWNPQGVQPQPSRGYFGNMLGGMGRMAGEWGQAAMGANEWMWGGIRGMAEAGGWTPNPMPSAPAQSPTIINNQQYLGMSESEINRFFRQGGGLPDNLSRLNGGG